MIKGETKKNRVIKICLTAVVCFIISTNQIINTEAATHSHTTDCYKSVVHTHKGTNTTKAGCYQGTSTYVKCGTYVQTSNEAVSGGYCSQCGGTYTIYKSTYKCSGCQKTVTYTWNHTHDEEDEFDTTHAWYEYALNCGYTEGTAYPIMYHEHEGSLSVKAGCYQGAKTTTTCTQGSWVYYEDPDNDGKGYCGSCDVEFEFNPAKYKCTYCGYIASTSAWVCQNGSHYTYSTPLDQQTHKYTGYTLSCGKPSGFYDCNGSTNVSGNLICNLKISNIIPKTKSQTIIK